MARRLRNHETHTLADAMVSRGIPKRVKRRSIFYFQEIERQEKHRFATLLMKEYVMDRKYQLNAQQKEFYVQNGYLLGLPPIYTRQEMNQLQSELPQLLTLLQAGETAKDVREWHETSRWLFDICMNPKIQDLVEGVLGPDFYLWASSFFIKEPRTKATVGWHQDAYYWPMTPHNSVTVWLAFSDVDEENGAMRIVPGSHKAGVIKHNRSVATESVLTLELEKGSFREDTAVSMCLKAGEVSLHDDAAVHGSPANPSERQRAGLAIRFSGTNVKNDLYVNPYFKTYLCRGVDRFKFNPVGIAPTRQFARPDFKAISIEEAGQRLHVSRGKYISKFVNSSTTDVDL